MNKLKTIELKLESVFNIMALIRTLVAVIFIYGMCISCCLIVIPLERAKDRHQELVDSYDKHLIHFHEEGIELPNCEFCSTYNDNEEENDAE
tara:strand:+ start:224 stop:499 length:276 start_codon:yes stop_codon:yes gene_type:complete